MPPKRTAAAASAVTTKPAKAKPAKPAKPAKAEGRVNGDITEPKATAIKPIAKKPITKAVVERPKRPAPKAAVKRKSPEDSDSLEPPVDAMKRLHTDSPNDDSDEQLPDPKRVKTAGKKPASKTPAAKRPASKAPAKKPAARKPASIKPKVTINKAPTQRLNVYVFGDGSNGELGLGNAKGQIEVKRPRLNPNLDADKVGVVRLAVGGMHTVALTHDNKILTWGVNDQGALGRDTAWEGGLRDMDDDSKMDDDDESEAPSDTGVNPHESTPAEIDVSDLPPGIIWTQVVATDSATFALTDDGLVYGWGTFRSNEGIFGFTTTQLIQRTPVQLESLSKITALAAGANHILALQSTGAVFAWGTGQQNQLGRRILERTKINSLVPQPFGLPKKIVGIGAGAYHSFAMHENGDVYSWGLNSYGETGQSQLIGEGGEADVHHPTIIQSLRGKGKVICIEGGAHHTVAVTDRGELLVWGRVDGYQLGIDITALPDADVIKDSSGNTRILKIPTQVPNINAAYAAAGSDHCVAVAKDGRAYAWGFSATYQTGLGTDTDVQRATHIDNTATRGKQLVWSGCGGQFSILAGLSDSKMTNGASK